MCVPSAVTHTAVSCTVWFLEQITLQFIQPDQTAPTLTQWTTVSVNSMSIDNTILSRNAHITFVCSKCQSIEAASDRHLVWHESEYC